MNKTYSVIWSEVRHAYIVVSEYARKGYAKAAMAALAAAVVVSTGMPAALAAAPPAVNAATVSGTDNVVTLRDGTTASDVNQAFELVYTHSDQIENNANNIATNKADIATNTSAIADNTNTIATNTSAIAANTNTIATHTNAIADNKAAIETNTADIATNKSDIATNKAAIATNTANIATNTGAIATNAGNISKLNSEIVNTNTVLGEVSKNLSALNTAVVDGFNTLNAEDAALHTEIKEEADARQAADEKEAATRAAADTALNGAVNGGLSLDDNGVLQKVTTSVNADGEIGWNKEAATQLVLNKGGENQITLSENGIKVGLNSTVQDANGFYAGGDTAAAAKAALNADGSIKGADGKFTVDTAGNVATNGGNINAGAGTVKGATLTDGTATITNGNINTTGTITGGTVTGGTVTSTGNISALGDINANGALTGASLSVTGDISGGSLTVNGTTSINGDMVATGKVQGSSITDGTATLQGGNLTNVGSIEAATVKTTGDATIGGNLKVDGEFNAGTLASRVDANNFTVISGGIVHSKNFNAGPEQLTSESTFNENGRNEYARDDESISTSVLSADEISQKIADVGDHPQAHAERTMKQGDDKKYSMADTVKDGAKTNVASQSATESSDVVTDDDGNTSTFRQKVDALLQEIKNAAGTESSSVEQKLDNITSTVTDGTNTTSTEQTTTDITNKAENGTITNTAKDLVNTATENMTNTVGKDLTTTVGGNMATTVTGDQTNTIGGNKSETVTGTSEETVTGKKTETYNGGLETTVTGEEKHTVNGGQTTTVTGNQANDITGDQTNTIGGKMTTTVTGDVTENYKANLTTTVGGDQSTEVTGDSSLKATNITTEATENMTNTVGKDLTTTVGGNMATTVTGDQTNTIGGKLTTTVTGDVTENYKANLTTTVGGDQSTEVTGDSSLKATNITTEATENMTNTVGKDLTTTVGGNMATTVTGDQTNIIGGDQSTEVAGDSSLEANNITNEAAFSIKDKVGTTTVTTTDGKTKLTNDAGDHKTEMDYADVLKDLGVGGNAAVTGTLDVTGKTTLNETEVKGTATFRENVTMDKDLSVGGNATVAGDVTAKSYKVGDKTYVDENGINANNQKITNVAPGELSANSTDAVNGAQLYQTNQRFDRLETRVDKVGANAAAMANLHPLDFDEDSKLSVAASLGNYRSETAGAVGLFYRPVDNVMFNVSTSFGNGENLVGGGVTFKLDRKPARVSKQDRADLVRHIEMLETRLDAFYSVFNPDMSKEFPDVAANHWAYEAVTKLAGNGIIQGFEDGKYHGDRTMTRYEMAEIIYNALMEGKKADAELVEEFKPELQAMAARYNAKTK